MHDPSGIDFNREKEEPLAGTVKYYQRHIFVCTGHGSWPAHIDEDGGFCQALAEALALAGPAVAQAVKLNACDEPSRGEDHDLLVFPDMVRYLGVAGCDLGALIEDHLAGGRVSQRLAYEPIMGQHLFVCVHENRDPRCGFCGPVLADLLAGEVARRGLAAGVHVHRSSHVGGHQFAGNVLIYPGGDWYGYVTPADVPAIVDRHVLRGQILPALWRGRMGLTPAEQLSWLQGL